MTVRWSVKNPRTSSPTVLSGACALGVDVSSARGGVLIRVACIAPGRTIPTAAGTSTIAIVVCSTLIAGATLGISTAAIVAPAMVASPAPSGVTAMAGFCNSKRTLKMEQDCVTDINMEDYRTAHGNHRRRDEQGLPSARQGCYLTSALRLSRH
jgi:hypothetical protein